MKLEKIKKEFWQIIENYSSLSPFLSENEYIVERRWLYNNERLKFRTNPYKYYERTK